MNFLTDGAEIESRIRELIAFETNEPVRLAVAYWGKGAEVLLGAKPYRIICDLESGACNPDVISTLWKRSGESIRMRSRFHAKVVVTSGGAVVSSANMSINGLGLSEGPDAGNYEAGVFFRPDSSDYNEIKTWFESHWTSASEISENDFSEARKKWNDRQKVNALHAALQALSADSLLQKEYQGDSVLRSVKESIHKRCRELMPDVPTRTVGKIASAAVHLTLNAAGQHQSYKSTLSPDGSHGVATDDWIAAHLRKIDRSNGEQQVKTLLQDFSRVPFVPFERPAQQAFMAAAALALCNFP